MATKDQYAVAVVNEENLSQTGVTIESGEETSSIIYCRGTAPTGILLPSNFTSCNLNFLVSKTPAGPFYSFCNLDGSEFTLPAEAGKWIPLNPTLFNSVLYMQVECDAPQDEDVTIDFSLAPIFQGIHA